MSDILTDYREWRDRQPDRIGTHGDRCHMRHERCMIHRLAAALAAEQAQHTLTDAEREAIREAAGAYFDNDDDEECARIAATLHGLLDRTK